MSPNTPPHDDALQIALAAVQLMTTFHGQAQADDTPEMNAVFPAAAFRVFVDGHANLMFRLARLRQSAGVPGALVKTWRERIGVGPEFPLHSPTDVERAMVAQIADLEAALTQMAPRGDDFARIVRATGGQQVLFCKELDCDDGNVLHCVARFDGYQAGTKISGIPDAEFDTVLNKVDMDCADRVLAYVAELGLMEVSHG
jgi:hypothetical protein